MMRSIFTGPGERNELGRAVMLGMNFAVGMAVFSFLGYYIDQKRGDGAILFTVCGILAGLGYGGLDRDPHVERAGEEGVGVWAEFRSQKSGFRIVSGKSPLGVSITTV